MKVTKATDLQCCLQSGREDRAGVTLVEVLVAIGVIALLAAISLPAVQSARGAAQRIECAARLQELGVATQNFHQANEILPDADHPLYDLLPYVEQVSLHAELAKSASDRVGPFNGPSIYRCPADSYAIAGSLHVNYRINEGSAFSFNGLRNAGILPMRFRDVSDGLSTTAMFAEAVIGALDLPYRPPRDDAVARQDPNRYLWHLSAFYDNEVVFIEQCMDPRNHVTTIPGAQWGAPQVYGGTETPYNHFVPPNRPGCLNTPPDELLSFTKAVPPTSYHTGGVNLLLCDGAVRFLSNSIDLQTWRNLGSRNGSDVVGPF
jgi:prepilin-type N-terminal cleavage/methylation domain-containing protein/prepilin-type processing-associated H-X9-DG protein